MVYKFRLMESLMKELCELTRQDLDDEYANIYDMIHPLDVPCNIEIDSDRDDFNIYTAINPNLHRSNRFSVWDSKLNRYNSGGKEDET
jgi:hypothetical protein